MVNPDGSTVVYPVSYHVLSHTRGLFQAGLGGGEGGDGGGWGGVEGVHLQSQVKGLETFYYKTHH